MRIDNLEYIRTIIVLLYPDFLEHDLVMLGRMTEYLMHFGFILIDILEGGRNREALEELPIKDRSAATAMCTHIFLLIIYT